MKTGECECGAIVAGNGAIVTAEGTEIAQCAVCHRHVAVTRIADRGNE